MDDKLGVYIEWDSSHPILPATCWRCGHEFQEGERAYENPEAETVGQQWETVCEQCKRTYKVSIRL